MPKTAFIVNNCYSVYRYFMMSSELRVGFVRVDFTEENRVVAGGITDGGFQNLQPTRGDVVTFRRNGPNFIGLSTLYLNEIRLYETVNLLEE